MYIYIHIYMYLYTKSYIFIILPLKFGVFKTICSGKLIYERFLGIL